MDDVNVYLSRVTGKRATDLAARWVARGLVRLSRLSVQESLPPIDESLSGLLTSDPPDWSEFGMQLMKEVGPITATTGGSLSKTLSHMGSLLSSLLEFDNERVPLPFAYHWSLELASLFGEDVAERELLHAELNAIRPG